MTDDVDKLRAELRGVQSRLDKDRHAHRLAIEQLQAALDERTIEVRGLRSTLDTWIRRARHAEARLDRERRNASERLATTVLELSGVRER